MDREMTPLRPWLARIRTAGCKLTVVDGGIGIEGDYTATDLTMATRYRHALLTAAARTHPAWWDHVSGRSTELPAGIDDIPSNGDAWACACCGAPAHQLGGDLLAWCEEHTWTP
jgi:hypothetical protein